MSSFKGKYTEVLETLAKNIEGFAVITDKSGQILLAYGANGEVVKHLHGQALPLAENAYEKEEHLRSSLAKALPMIAKVAGGEAGHFGQRFKV